MKIYLVEKSQATIAKYLGVYGHTLTKEQSAELEQAYKDLAYSQQNCMHYWETYTSFSWSGRMCRYCDKREDPDQAR
jgi:hypothetical protein